MQNRERLLLSLAAVRAVHHADRLPQVLETLCVRYDLAHMTFLLVDIAGQAVRYPFFCTTYSDLWTNTYVQNDYFDIDPVIDVLRWALLPVDWSSLDWRSEQASQLLDRAKSHGIGPQGLTIPVRGPNGARSLFSVTSNRSKREWSRLRASNIHELHILSHYLHETVLAVTHLGEAVSYRTLSNRERECLQLLAAGLISKQIAAALGISESAVKLYARSARKKLGATTSYQAIAKACFLGLIAL